jgi:cytochrome P450
MTASEATGATVTFNPFEPGFFDNPYAQYAELRRADPVHHSPLGIWVLFRYEDVNRLLRDPKLSVSFDNANPMLRTQMMQAVSGDRPERGNRSILQLDPPDHTRLRRLVQKAFTPRMVESLRPRVQALVDDALDAVAGRGEMDVVMDLAFPLPFTVISEMLGMPEADRLRLRGWSHTMVKTLDPILTPDDVQAAMEAGDQMLAHVQDTIEWKRTHPADDLLTGLINAEEGGDTLTTEELIDQVMLLFIAGHETTVNLIGNGTLALLRNRGELDRLRADPSFDANAVDELLRYDSPVQFSRRIATDDIEVGGRTIEAGAFVMTALGSANHDEERWGPDADALDLARHGAAQHVSFGSGAHHCLGAPLARLEGQVAIGTLVRRFPGIELDGDQPAWNGRIVLRGLDSLPVSLG